MHGYLADVRVARTLNNRSTLADDINGSSSDDSHFPCLSGNLDRLDGTAELAELNRDLGTKGRVVLDQLDVGSGGFTAGELIDTLE